MTIAELFKNIYLKLRDYGVDQPHLEASWILEKFAQVSQLTRITEPEKKIEDNKCVEVELAAKRRKTGEPLAYILGEKEFYGYLFYVDKTVLIPRPETELLVTHVVDWVDKNKFGEEISILDLGAGSGCIGLTILKECPRAKLTAVDVSKEAIQIAKKNATALGVLERVEFLHLDAAKVENLLNQFDVIVANPPYIDEEDKNIEKHVVEFEPHLALFSDESGKGAARRWLKAIPKILKPQSIVAFEIGATQGRDILNSFIDLKIFKKCSIIKDLAEHDRVIFAEKGQ